jgi:hypothetical protein
VACEGDEAGTSEAAPIFEMMKRFGLVVQEETKLIPTDVVDVEAEPTIAEPSSENEDEDDDNILSPSKPSHIEFGKSIVKAEDLILMKKLGYFGENDDRLVRFAREEVILELKDDEVVVFKIFFRAGLWFPLYEMIGEVLKKFKIYLHQLTPKAIVRLSVYIWALRSQGKSANAEGFCRMHELHYQTKARADGLHRTLGATSLHTERTPRLL